MQFLSTLRIISILFLFCAAVLCPAVSLKHSAVNFPYEDAYVNTNRPTLTGILRDGEDIPLALETIRIIIDDVHIATTQTQSSGIFSYTIPAENSFTDGAHTVRVICDSSSETIGPINFTIDTSIPPAPVLSTPTPGATVGNPVTVTGATTYAYASVFVFWDDNSYANTVYADGQGNWSSEETLSLGEHNVSAQVQSLAGNQGPLCAPITFTVS